MTISQKKREIIFTRDGGVCAYCGTMNDLTIHHRINRGAGGSKLFNGLAFLLTICTTCNGLFESNAAIARAAKKFGYKLSRNANPPVNPTEVPVWYTKEAAYFLLDNDGNRTEIKDGK